ncbi:MAG: hypothetical protein ACKOGP_01660, partial [Bacteroidota bacterium]
MKNLTMNLRLQKMINWLLATFKLLLGRTLHKQSAARPRRLSPASPTLTAFAVVLGLMGVSEVSWGQRFAVTTGNWNGAIWATTAGGNAGSATTPTSTDAVTINPGITVTVTANATCASITFGGGTGGNATLTVNSGITLTSTGAVTLNSTTTANNNPSASITGAGTLTAGSIVVGTVITGVASNSTATLTATIANINSSGNLTIRASGDKIAGNSYAYNSTFSLSSGSSNINLSGQIVTSTTVNGSSATIIPTFTTGTFTGTLNLTNANPVATPSTNAVLNLASGTIDYSGTIQTVSARAYNKLTLSNSGVKT